MKIKTFLICSFLLGVVFVGCSRKEKQPTFTVDLIENETSIRFESDTKNLGRLSEGEKVTCSFRFKNTGKYPLLITEAKATCGCTVADFPSSPIAVGEEALVTITYDSKGDRGLRVVKEVTVVANTRPTQTKLSIIAEVY